MEFFNYHKAGWGLRIWRLDFDYFPQAVKGTKLCVLWSGKVLLGRMG